MPGGLGFVQRVRDRPVEFSVICVYHDETILRENLLKGLREQTKEFELILLDNRKGTFKSGSEALNYGGNKAKGKYLIFLHSDVVLRGKHWLDSATAFLQKVPKLGCAGSVGAREGVQYPHSGIVGFIKDGRSGLRGEPLGKPELVQTLDECLLIVPRRLFSKLKFDEETFKSWHCYGADYCLNAKRIHGLDTYVLPLLIEHNTSGFATGLGNLAKDREKLFHKHKDRFKQIALTTGFIDASKSSSGLMHYLFESLVLAFIFLKQPKLLPYRAKSFLRYMIWRVT